MRLSGNGKWQRSPENPRGLDAGDRNGKMNGSKEPGVVSGSAHMGNIGILAEVLTALASPKTRVC